MIRLAVRVERERAELVLAELLEYAPAGVEELADGELVEYALYGAPGELPDVGTLRAAVGGGTVEIVTSTIADDWHERWREFHRPVDVAAGGRRLRVRPPWEPARTGACEDELDVVIDPAQAFGTGAHATTRLCLELLLELDAGGPFLDVGCGSGVLAVAAARLGYAPVTAYDFDRLAVAAARSNAAENGVSIAVERRDLRRGQLPSAPTVAANLLAPLLRIYAERMGTPPRRLLASGLLVSELDELAAAFAARGMREAVRRTRGEWGALLLLG